MRFRSLLLVVLVVCTAAACTAAADTAAAAQQVDWQQRLVGHPLYLRGAWMEPVLEFDGAGKPLHDAHTGPLTLSGLDVERVAVHGARMQIQGYRVTLVADDNGVLQRRNQTSTTAMFGTYQRKYVSRDAIKLTLHADEAGSFEPALRAVIADGLPDLMDSVPPYWSCYAHAYFPGDLTAAAAAQQAERCARSKGVHLEAGEDGVTQPKLDAPLTMQGTREAAQARLSGVSCVRFTVGPHGVPLRFQVVRAVGAGMDEMLLAALSASHFTAPMQDGRPVAADMEYQLGFHAQ